MGKTEGNEISIDMSLFKTIDEYHEKNKTEKIKLILLKLGAKDLPDITDKHMVLLSDKHNKDVKILLNEHLSDRVSFSPFVELSSFTIFVKPSIGVTFPFPAPRPKIKGGGPRVVEILHG